MQFLTKKKPYIPNISYYFIYLFTVNIVHMHWGIPNFYPYVNIYTSEVSQKIEVTPLLICFFLEKLRYTFLFSLQICFLFFNMLSYL